MSKPPIEYRPKPNPNKLENSSAVEQRPVKSSVSGSIPDSPAIKPNKGIRLLAQLLAEKEARRVANVEAQRRFRAKQKGEVK